MDQVKLIQTLKVAFHRQVWDTYLQKIIAFLHAIEPEREWKILVVYSVLSEISGGSRISQRDAPTPEGDADLLLANFLAKNCMKMKEFGPSLGYPWIRHWKWNLVWVASVVFFTSDLATAKAECDLCNLLRVESAMEYVHLFQNLGHD